MYTPEERRRRDASPWTIVQGILAPLQLLAFLVSLWLVLQFLKTGEGAAAATTSVIVNDQRETCWTDIRATVRVRVEPELNADGTVSFDPAEMFKLTADLTNDEDDDEWR